MYEFTRQQKQILKMGGKSNVGIAMIDVLKDMIKTISDISTIKGDYAVQVEARKVAKDTLNELIEVMETTVVQKDFDQNFDEEEGYG